METSWILLAHRSICYIDDVRYIVCTFVYYLIDLVEGARPLARWGNHSATVLWVWRRTMMLSLMSLIHLGPGGAPPLEGPPLEGDGLTLAQTS